VEDGDVRESEPVNITRMLIQRTERNLANSQELALQISLSSWALSIRLCLSLLNELRY